MIVNGRLFVKTFLFAYIISFYKSEALDFHHPSRTYHDKIYSCQSDIYNPFTNATAFFISASSGCPFAIPPTSLNGPNVS